MEEFGDGGIRDVEESGKVLDGADRLALNKIRGVKPPVCGCVEPTKVDEFLALADG